MATHLHSFDQSNFAADKPINRRRAKPRVVRPADLKDSTHTLHAKFPWAGAAFKQFSRIMEDMRRPFPCLFARAAHEAEKLYFLLVGSPCERAQLRRVRAGLLEYLTLTDKLEGLEASMNALIILFAPVEPMLPLAEYHRQAWRVMQDWIDHDPQRWPVNVPENPDHPLWSLCFRGVPLFVNVS